MNASVALKQVYMRYLDRYEKIHFLGDNNERADDNEDENRHKKWNDKSHNEIPLKYNYSQHMVPGTNKYASFNSRIKINQMLTLQTVFE